MYWCRVLMVGVVSEKRATLQMCLQPQGIRVVGVNSGPDAQRRLSRGMFGAVLLDLEAVGDTAFRLCQSIHVTYPHTSIMVLMDRVCVETESSLFDLGVADVVVGAQAEPLGLAKRVLARVRASEGECPLRIGIVEIDFARAEVRRGGVREPFTEMVGDVLRYFLKNPNRTLSRRELSSEVWGRRGWQPDPEMQKTVDVHVGKVRRLIEPDPAHPRMVKAVRGVGWRLELPRISSRAVE